MELRTNSSYIPVQHKLTDFYSQDCVVRPESLNIIQSNHKSMTKR